MEMLKTKGTDLKGKVCLISGSGNVAQYTAEKVLELGGKVVTMSDPMVTSTIRTESTVPNWIISWS